MTEHEDILGKIVSLAKRRGFIFQGSEIYGGLAGVYDYGPLGVALKNNIKNLWWKMFVEDREDMYGIDAAILMNAKAWEASGHVSGFSDPMVECQNKDCKNKRHRVDHLVGTEIYSEILRRLNDPKVLNPLISKISKEVSDSIPKEIGREPYSGYGEFSARQGVEKKIKEFENKVGVIMQTALAKNKIECPGCGQISWGMPKQFNMMFKTYVGAIENDESVSYLRPETAGGMFVNFKNIVDAFHPKLPFGLAQIGKAFRNEIAPRDFIFRVRELEQMEVEYFVRPSEWEKYFEEWRNRMHAWISEVGIDEAKIHELEVAEADRAHYSKRTIDFEFDYPFGRKELYGLAYRTDFDLSAHAKTSTVDLSYRDEETGERFVPHVIEPSLGLDRTILAVLLSAYREDEMGEEKRVYLAFKPRVAPVTVAVFPLLKNKPELVEKARGIFMDLKAGSSGLKVMFDDNGNIGKRYRRQDEIGTPFCVTIDFETLENDTVTIRERDSWKQERIAVSELAGFIKEKIS